MPFSLKRGELTGAAAHLYIPTRRKARHYADTFSHALFLAKRLGAHHGAQFAWDMAGEVAALLPAGADLVAAPPPSHAGTWYFARELAVAVSDKSGIALGRPLRWAVTGQEASKAIVHQGGKGRALGRWAECLEDLTGRRVVIVDDLYTTGITAQLTADALREVGAEVLGVVALALTEPTRARPDCERRRLEVTQWRIRTRRARTCCP